MIDFRDITSFYIDGRDVSILKIDNRVVWQKGGGIDYLTFTGQQDGSYVTLNSVGTPDNIVLEYKKNDSYWRRYDIGFIIGLDEGDKVQFRGDNSTFSKDGDNYYKFVSIGKVAASGSIMTLLSSDDTERTVPASGFIKLFFGNTSLTKAPELPAEDLSLFSYAMMFYGCTALTTGPSVLPAKDSLESDVYYAMFAGCTSLTTAPKIMLENPGITAMAYMFENCENLSRVEVNFTNWDESPLRAWLDNVAPTGILIGPAGLEEPEEYSSSTIPEGWKFDSNYCTFEATSNTPTTVQLAKVEKYGYTVPVLNMEYRTITGNNYSDWEGYSVGQSISLSYQDKVQFRGENAQLANPTSPEFAHHSFKFTGGNIKQTGSIYSLLSHSRTQPTSTAYAFSRLFENCSLLKSFKGFEVENPGQFAFSEMFYGCTGITALPKIRISGTISTYAFHQVFYECSSLVDASQFEINGSLEIPSSGYGRQFYGSFYSCTSLVDAPVLNFTNTARESFDNMFRKCTSLVEAPYIPVGAQERDCYDYMFNECSKLNYVKVGFTSWTDYSGYWLQDVASTGTFVCPAALPEERGVSRIPSNWTIVRT